jgi:hypothetical protein
MKCKFGLEDLIKSEGCIRLRLYDKVGIDTSHWAVVDFRIINNKIVMKMWTNQFTRLFNMGKGTKPRIIE